jgi:tetratricopeptide (TPR) repeat protein
LSKVHTPDQLAAQGKRNFLKGSFEEAAGLFEAAVAGYQAVDDQLNAAEMRNNQSVALLQAGHAEAALNAASGTAEIFAEADDKQRQALALGNQAAALHKLGDNEEAEKYYRQSAELFKETGDKENRASVLQSISRLQLGTGRYMEALGSADSSLESRSKLNIAQRILKKQLNNLKEKLNIK